MPRRIVAKVYERDGVTHVRDLSEDNGRSWLEDMNAPGSWRLSLPVGHTDSAYLTDGRIVRFFVDGVARFAGPIEPVKKVAADPSKRLSGKDLGFSGRGGLALLDRAAVYLEPLMQGLAFDERYFGAMSSDFDDSTWTPVVDLAPVTESDVTINPKYPYPDAWDDPLAQWIWDGTGFTPPTAVGDVWMRKGGGAGGLGFTISYDTTVRFSVAFDDFGELYVNGCKVLALTEIDKWKKTSTVDLPMLAGYHTVLLKGTNADRPDPSTNGAAVAFSIRELSGGNTVGPEILYSSSVFFKMLAYPSAPPGMFPGEILDVLFLEMQARGTNTELSWSFTRTHDSAGVPWPTAVDVSFPVGTSYTEVVKKFVDEHLIDVAFDPATMTIHAYVNRGAPLADPIAAKLGPAVDANLSRLVFEKKPPGPNAVLSKDATGRWTETIDGTAIAAYGRRETALSTGSAPTAEASSRQVAAFLADHSEPVTSITDAQIENVDFDPLAELEVGDTMTAPDYADGTTATYRIYGIAVDEDDAGNPIVTPELVKV